MQGEGGAEQTAGQEACRIEELEGEGGGGTNKPVQLAEGGGEDLREGPAHPHLPHLVWP